MEQIPLSILDDDAYGSRGATRNEINQALANLNPLWTDFRQMYYGESATAGSIFEFAAFGGPEFALSPAVLTVAVGMELEWQLPTDGDLFSRAEQAARDIHLYRREYITKEQVRTAYPDIANGPTYGLYRYFGEDLDKLAAWCAHYSALIVQEDSP